MAGARPVWLCVIVLCVFGAEPVNITVNNSTGERRGKNILQWLGVDSLTPDPYLLKANKLCINGNLFQCFKYRALSTFDNFFLQEKHELTEQVHLLRMPTSHVQLVVKEPYEFSSEPRAEETEWHQFMKFVLRKIERFVKTTAFEIDVPEEITEHGRYAPRFIDEIYSEIDTLENKNDSPFSFEKNCVLVCISGYVSTGMRRHLGHRPTRHNCECEARTKLKKLFVPMLIILKLFKLKLLLFLPLILGLASFKKVLGFVALVVPGLIGFFKLCNPDLNHNYGSYGHSDYYHSPPQKYNIHGFAIPDRRVQTTFHTIDAQQNTPFRDDNSPYGHNHAYQSYYQQNFNNR